MSKIVSSTTRIVAGALLTASLLTSAAFAQQPQPIRIRGTIESVDGALLTVKDRDGAERKVKLTDTATITGIVKTTMADVKPGS